jgi:hypothetical protein
MHGPGIESGMNDLQKHAAHGRGSLSFPPHQRTNRSRAAKVDQRPRVGLRLPEDVGGLEITMAQARLMQPRQPRRYVAEHAHRDWRVGRDSK